MSALINFLRKAYLNPAEHINKPKPPSDPNHGLSQSTSKSSLSESIYPSRECVYKDQDDIAMIDSERALVKVRVHISESSSYSNVFLILIIAQV